MRRLLPAAVSIPRSSEKVLGQFTGTMIGTWDSPVTKISPAFLELSFFMEEETILDKHQKCGISQYVQKRNAEQGTRVENAEGQGVKEGPTAVLKVRVRAHLIEKGAKTQRAMGQGTF